jgi:hypothetical protein
MAEIDLQDLCERGQIELMETRYLDAANTLSRAEQAAWETRSFDTLARLYLPLQEARRQIRQRCGEGAVRMHLFPINPNQAIDPRQVLRDIPHGQLLVGGWGNAEPALRLRQLAHDQHLYVETFLGSVRLTEEGKTVVEILPTGDWKAQKLQLSGTEIPADSSTGNAETYASVMAIWERLHAPFLAAAAAVADPIQRMQAYRFTLQVDPACELAHQFLAEIARNLSRKA